MKIISKKILSLSILSSILLFDGCSSHETILSSDSHLYNESFGVVDNFEVDARINEEILAQNTPVEIDNQLSSNPEWTTELILDPDAVTAEEYVQAPPIITYKYMDDPKFYTVARWKSRNN